MLQRINTWRRMAATLACAASGLCLAAPGAVAQPHNPGAPAAADLDAPAPAPAAAMAAFNAVDGWVRQWRTPMDPTGLASFASAAVTLRYEGSIVGRGVAVSSDPAGGSGILIFAAKRAMDEAKERLPIQRDALMEESLKAAAGRIAITVELGGRGVPISPDEWADLVNLVPPGLEGVSVRIGDRVAAIFPETMLCTGTDAAAAGRALVAKVSADPTFGLKPPKELREKHGVEFYRFKVSVVGQAAEKMSPEFFIRGGRVVRMRDIDESGLRRWADALAAHIVADATDLVPAPNATQGTLQPVQGTYEQVASLTDWLLCSLALSDYVSTCRVTSGEAGNTAFELFAGTARHTVSRYPRDPVLAALGSIRVGKGIPARTTPRDLEPLPVGPFVAESPLRLAAFVASDGTLEGVSGPAAGLVAYGLVLTPDMSVSRRVADAVVRKVFVATPPGKLVAQMPWLGWADQASHRDGDLPSATALREMRAQVWQFQLKAEALPPDSLDLAGGIVFTGARQPLPTWQLARPLAFIASMLRDPRLTEDGESAAELARLLASLRFLRQLTAESAEAHMYKDPSRAIGGVRASLFDQRMPPEATAMTLLAVCEMIKSLEAIKQRQKQEK